MKRKQLYEEQDPEANLYNQAGRKNVFQTPPDYFEKLPVEISSKLHAEPSVSVIRKWIPLHLVTAAACLILIVAAGILYFRFPGGNKPVTTEFTYDDFNNTEMISDMEESLLMEALTSEKVEISELPEQKNGNVQHFHDYLIENNTDINLIISEL